MHLRRPAFLGQRHHLLLHFHRHIPRLKPEHILHFQQLTHRPLDLQFPAIQNADPIAHIFHIRQLVRAQQHGLARPLQFLDQVLHLQRAQRVEPRCRLIQDHQVRIVQ